MVGGVIATLLVPMLRPVLGWFTACIVFVAVSLVLMIPLLFTVKERHSENAIAESNPGLKDMLRYLKHNKYLIVALIARCRVNPFPLRRVKGHVLVLGVTGGMALAILANFITGWIMNILNNFGIPSPEFTETIQPTFISLVLHLISTAVLPAIIEEFIFRGYVLGSLRAHGDGVAIVVSAALFGLFHGNLTQIPFAFILGLVMGYLMVATNSILPAVLVHFANNAMSVLLSYWHQFCPGYENAITVAVFAVVTAIGVAALLAVRSRPDFFEPIGNGKSTLSAGTRAGRVLTAPAMIVGLCLIGLEIISSVVVSFL
jgi:membrane protease YdiL (CAAX protease family)